VAYLHGTAVEALLSSLRQPQTAADLILHWSRLLPTFAAIEVLHWMWNRQVITPAGHRMGYCPTDELKRKGNTVCYPTNR
jgi:hypothetical protein